MKLTKIEHSCVLVEDSGQVFMTDPGVFAWQSGNFDIDKLDRLDAVIVTHKHGDHFVLDFAKVLVQKFPELLWLTPSDLHSDLSDIGVKHVTNQSNEMYDVKEIDHAPVEPFGVQVKNLLVNYNNKLTITGDTHHFDSTKDLLFLAVQAPWGSTVEALRLAMDMKPKYVFPVHDWMWNKDWKQNVYDRFDTVLKDNGIRFLKPVNGQTTEIDL